MQFLFSSPFFSDSHYFVPGCLELGFLLTATEERCLAANDFLPVCTTEDCRLVPVLVVSAVHFVLSRFSFWPKSNAVEGCYWLSLVDQYIVHVQLSH